MTPASDKNASPADSSDDLRSLVHGIKVSQDYFQDAIEGCIADLKTDLLERITNVSGAQVDLSRRLADVEKGDIRRDMKCEAHTKILDEAQKVLPVVEVEIEKAVKDAVATAERTHVQMTNDYQERCKGNAEKMKHLEDNTNQNLAQLQRVYEDRMKTMEINHRADMNAAEERCKAEVEAFKTYMKWGIATAVVLTGVVIALLQWIVTH